MVIFLAVGTLKFGFQSMDIPHGITNLFKFHGIHPDSPQIPHGLSPYLILDNSL